jgi:uncharacterized membrane protein
MSLVAARHARCRRPGTAIVLFSGRHHMTQVHALMGADGSAARPVVRTIRVADLKDVLAAGISDFSAMPSHAVFLCLIYPIVGLILARVIVGYDVLSLLFPLAAGFALLGPFAAIGLYELSRQHEQGLDPSWQDAFDVLHSPSRGAIGILGLLLLAIFVIWVAIAQAIYVANFGYEPAASIPQFLRQVFTTPAGWMLIIVGNGIGFLFALAVLIVSVVSFPLLLEVFVRQFLHLILYFLLPLEFAELLLHHHNHRN